jgi:hypothetical protein
LYLSTVPALPLTNGALTGWPREWVTRSPKGPWGLTSWHQCKQGCLRSHSKNWIPSPGAPDRYLQDLKREGPGAEEGECICQQDGSGHWAGPQCNQCQDGYWGPDCSRAHLNGRPGLLMQWRFVCSSGASGWGGTVVAVGRIHRAASISFPECHPLLACIGWASEVLPPLCNTAPDCLDRERRPSGMSRARATSTGPATGWMATATATPTQSWAQGPPFSGTGPRACPRSCIVQGLLPAQCMVYTVRQTPLWLLL